MPIMYQLQTESSKMGTTIRRLFLVLVLCVQTYATGSVPAHCHCKPDGEHTNVSILQLRRLTQ